MIYLKLRLNVWIGLLSKTNLPVSRDQRMLLIANEAIENAIRYTGLTVMDSVQEQQRKGPAHRKARGL